jgi:D-serine deaminase-like pyridoxal phosphate-dependent protein
MTDHRITRPTLILDEQKVRRNIARMVQRARDARVQLRPHCKTHQSGTIGQWFRDAGIERITVSSLEMAAYFADHGWRDITVAFPCNVAQMDLLQQLAGRVALGIVVDSVETVVILQQALRRPVRIWIKVDVGYGRAGIPWDNTEALAAVAKALAPDSTAPAHLQLVGLLSHAGHSYGADSAEALRDIARSSLQQLQAAQQIVQEHSKVVCLLSSGDTPTIGSNQAIAGLDEIRPGNFVFHDVMQLALGSCDEADIALAVACPVVAVYRQRQEVLVYGGASHFSKDSLGPQRHRHLTGLAAQTAPLFGLVVDPPEGSGPWGRIRPDAVLVRISQEHGILRVEDSGLDLCRIGNPLYILPIHSCLTADLYPAYQNLEGDQVSRYRTNDPVAAAAGAIPDRAGQGAPGVVDGTSEATGQR